MGGLRRYLGLQARAKTGLTSGVLISGLLALLGAALTFAFVLVTVFIWLADRYGALVSALALAGVFLLTAIVALLCCIAIRRRTIERAQQALAARSSAIWLDPRLVGGAVQVSRAVGWGKVATLLAVGVLAAGVGALWFGHNRSGGERDVRDEDDEDDERAERSWFARAA